MDNLDSQFDELEQHLVEAIALIKKLSRQISVPTSHTTEIRVLLKETLNLVEQLRELVDQQPPQPGENMGKTF